MASFSDYLVDDSGYRLPVVGATVFLLSDVTTVAQSLTDDYGKFTFNVPDGKYTVDARMGGVTIARSDVNIGIVADYIGATGPSNNTRATLAALKAAATTDLTSLYDNAVWSWTTGDFTGRADDTTIVKADGAPLTTGAWVRQTAAKLTVQRTDPGSRPRTVTDKFRETITPQDFGAIADGTLHPLSERYPTLAAAQADYPFVTGLLQTVDYAALQAALAAAESRGEVFVPGGDYMIGGATLRFGNYLAVRGANRGGDGLATGARIISAGGAPILQNKYATNCTYVRMGHLQLIGGTHAIFVDATANCSFMHLEHLVVSGATVSDMRFNRLEVSTIAYCVLINAARSSYGIEFANNPINDDLLLKNRISSHGLGQLGFAAGCEGVQVLAGSFEAGGVAGKAAITAIGTTVPVRNLSVRGVYFEGIGEYLLRGSNMTGVEFANCKTTNTFANAPVKFDVTDSSLIVFGTNFWELPTPGPANYLLAGTNDNLIGTGSNVWSRKGPRGGRVVSKVYSGLGNLTFSAINVARASGGAGTTGDQTKQAVLDGTLTVRATGYNAGGDFVYTVLKQRIVLVAPPGGNLVSTMPAPETVTSDASFAVVFNMNFTPTLGNYAINLVGANAAGQRELSFTFDYDVGAFNDAEVFAVTL